MKENIYPYKGRYVTSQEGAGHHVISIQDINTSAYILRFGRNDIPFIPGQYLSLGIPGKNELREYSIFSPTTEPWFEVLVREVEDGSVSKQLRKLKPGDALRVEGPFGFFTLPPDKPESRYLFIASGTGVSPFHSIIRSGAPANFTLIHGVRSSSESFLRGALDPEQYIVCSSRDDSGDFHGRVSAWLKENPQPKDSLCYLCGNCEMIYDCFDILESQGISPENLHAEVYF